VERMAAGLNPGCIALVDTQQGSSAGSGGGRKSQEPKQDLRAPANLQRFGGS
jgi:hypothetical protein